MYIPEMPKNGGGGFLKRKARSLYLFTHPRT